MKVVDSTVLMGSTRSYTESFEEHTDLRVWIDAGRRQPRDTVTISGRARSCAEACRMTGGNDIAPDAGLEISLRKLIAEILAGRRIDVLHIEDVTGGDTRRATEGTAGLPDGAGTGQGWGLDYSHDEEYTERETVVLEARGVVKTADGREIEFSLGLVMDRRYVESHEIRIRAGDALKDPLVINLDGSPVELSGRTFAFDLDADGTPDSLDGLPAGKGYIAFDRNGNGTIDDGTELFGPATGDALMELERLDADGNGWVDEGDDAFSSLYVLTFDDDGGQVLRSMRDAGVGALFASGAATPFDLKDGLTGQSSGRVRATGIYLAENGSAGTIQQVDLRV